MYCRYRHVCVSDNKVVGIVVLNVFNSILKSLHTLQSVAFVEGQVGFVGYAIGCCGINDLTIELEEGIVSVLHTLRHLRDVCVESDTQKSLLCEDLIN